MTILSRRAWKDTLSPSDRDIFQQSNQLSYNQISIVFRAFEALETLITDENVRAKIRQARIDMDAIANRTPLEGETPDPEIREITEGVFYGKLHIASKLRIVDKVIRMSLGVLQEFAQAAFSFLLFKLKLSRYYK